MEELKILFASDIHGNTLQYDKLFKHASKNRFDLLIIGGDLTPKDKLNRTPKKQGEFLKKYLFKKIIDFKKQHKTKILIILGNDDFKSNEDILIKNQGAEFDYIGQRSVKFEDFIITGYSYVPITPFKHKDWEKLDLNNTPENRQDIIFKGIINNSLEKKFIIKNRTDTIERDLKLMNIDKNTILVSHSPPYNTNLDMLTDKRHVGSEALREIIIQKKPLLVLSGHIHETVIASGKYEDKIGETICLCAGNNYLEEKIIMLEITINSNKKIFSKRIRV